MITIKVRPNGSLLVEGEDVKVVDWNGVEYVLSKKPFSLCRCGQSKRKPFCDASHKLCNFQAEEAAPGPNAVPPPVAPPAQPGN